MNECSKIKNIETIDESEFFVSDNLEHLSQLFNAMSDPTRLKIIFVLSKGELSVQDIANRLDMSQSSISHQLKTLRVIHLVKYRRDGKKILYSLDDDHVLQLFAEGLEHVLHLYD